MASLEKDGKVSKEDLLNYLRNEGRVRFEEIDVGKAFQPQDLERMRQEAEQSGDFSRYDEALLQNLHDGTKYAQYQLPGGENYREVVLAMPTQGEKRTPNQIAQAKYGKDFYDLTRDQMEEINSEMQKNLRGTDASYTSSHFPDIPNYVAHMRTNERVDADGRLGLFVEEFQSDRHQEGRKKGYKEGVLAARFQTRETAERASKRLNDSGDVSTVVEIDGQFAITSQKGEQGKIADAPFRTTWPLQLFKRALRDAVDSGKEWVGWTTGDTQNDRFDLSKSVDSISTEAMIGYPDGFRVISIKLSNRTESPSTLGVDANGNVISGWGNTGDAYAGKNISEVIGKDISEKIMNGQPSAVYRGDDLKIGGSGMKGFYDNILPKEIGKYVKPFGGKVEKSQIGSSKLRIEKDGNSFAVVGDDNTVSGVYDTQSQAQQRIDDLGGSKAATPIWKVSITLEMRQLAQGQMRFMPEGERKIIDQKIPEKEGGNMSPSTWDSLKIVGYNPEASEKTQIATTAPTYESIVKANATQGMEVLDFSAGRGIGTKAMKAIGKKVGFNVEGYEPFSNKQTRVIAPEYEGEESINQIPDNSKDIIINNAVLNVVPEATGRQIVNQIYSKLKPGGSAFINVMGWNNIKNRLDNPKTKLVGPREVITQKGTFQKGYTAQSLRSLIEQELPDAKIVRTSHGDIGFKVTKPASPAETMPAINPPAKTGQMRFLPEPVEKLSAFKGKRVQVLTSDLSLVGDVKYGDYTASFKGGPGYLDNDGWAFTDKAAADAFVTRWKKDGEPLIGLASLGSANHLNSLDARKAYAEKWKYLVSTGEISEELATSHIKKAMKRIIDSDSKNVKADWRNAAKMIENVDDLSNYFDKIPWAAAPMFYSKLTAKTLPIKYKTLVELGLDLNSVAKEYRQPEFEGAELGDLYAIAEYDGSNPEYKPELNKAYPWRIKFKKKATLSEMHNVAKLTTDPRAFAKKKVGGRLGAQPLMVTGINLDKLMTGDIAGSAKPLILREGTQKTKSNKATQFGSGNPEAYRSYQQIQAERNAKKPKKKSKSKGNSSAIANASNLK